MIHSTWFCHWNLTWFILTNVLKLGVAIGSGHKQVGSMLVGPKKVKPELNLYNKQVRIWNLDPTFKQVRIWNMNLTCLINRLPDPTYSTCLINSQFKLDNKLVLTCWIKREIQGLPWAANGDGISLENPFIRMGPWHWQCLPWEPSIYGAHGMAPKVSPLRTHPSSWVNTGGVSPKNHFICGALAASSLRTSFRIILGTAVEKMKKRNKKLGLWASN